MHLPGETELQGQCQSKAATVFNISKLPLGAFELAFRSFKVINVNVRPVRHYLEGRVRPTILLCTLSAHLMGYVKSRLASLTFRDTEVPTHESPVAKKHVSSSASAKIARNVSNVNQDGTPIEGLPKH